MSDFVVKAALTQLGERIGGSVLGTGVATAAYGAALSQAEVINASNNYRDGKLTYSDMMSATLAVETFLLGVGILTFAPGIAIASAVLGVAALGVTYLRDGIAIDDAWDAVKNGISGGQQPWDFLPAAYDAYKKSAYERNISTSTNDNFRAATTPPRRDPLAIDLDNDGIETVGIPATGSPILFDHDANGIKTGTGWLKGDDAWLVLDRNVNGSIDSGLELFGVDTTITVTTVVPGNTGASSTVTRKATSGFEALRTLDTGNGTAGSAGFGDGVFNASDAGFTQVRLWQDLNQDGISQSSELFTLADKGITSIGLNASSTTTDLGNGNTVTGQATVTRSNGSTTQIDSVDLQASNLNLADNPFYREFTDTFPLTSAAQALPDIGGSGVLRDLREAMSLGAAQAQQLADLVAGFAAAGTRDVRGCPVVNGNSRS